MDAGVLVSISNVIHRLNHDNVLSLLPNIASFYSYHDHKASPVFWLYDLSGVVLVA